MPGKHRDPPAQARRYPVPEVRREDRDLERRAGYRMQEVRAYERAAHRHVLRRVVRLCERVRGRGEAREAQKSGEGLISVHAVRKLVSLTAFTCFSRRLQN